jgi:hypothetical protein
MAPLSKLPSINENHPSEADLEIIKSLFGEGEKVAKSLKIKEILIPAITFIFLSLPFTDSLIRNNIVDNDIMILVIKTVILIIVLVIMQLSI